MSLSLSVAAALIGCATTSKITEDNFARIEFGMTQAETVAILGEPTRNMRAMIYSTVETGEIPVEGEATIWEGRAFKIVAIFSDDGKLLSKSMDSE